MEIGHRRGEVADLYAKILFFLTNLIMRKASRATFVVVE